MTANTTEGSLTLPDGLELYTKTWNTEGPPRATIAFIHGFSDHCNTYGELFPNLASAGIEIRSFDQRGWGLSVKQKRERERGNTGPTAQVLSDMHVFLQSLPLSNVPLFLMGHSMGGGQVLNYIFHPDSPYKSGSPKLTGVLLFSPLIAIHESSRPSWLTVSAGRIVAKLVPHMQRPSGKALDKSWVSRDPEVVRAVEQDKLCHDIGTYQGLAGMLDRAIWLEGMFAGDWVKSDFPIWFGHGNGDHITSYDAVKVFTACLKESGGDVTFETYEGGYHKLSADLPETKNKFTADVRDWVLGKAPETESRGEQAKL